MSSLSPFVIAEEIDTNFPSISGIAIDSDGNPMSGVAMSFTGTDSRSTETDSDGGFRVVNLTPNGNYNVSPKQVGYLFDEYNTNFVNVTGEETVVCEGTQRNFQISGQVTDGNGVGINDVTVELTGAAQASVQTDSNGNYTFTSLPADGSFTVTPFGDTTSFTPSAATVEPLSSDVAGVDFQTFTLTSATTAIGGRILSGGGRPIRNLSVTIAGGSLGQPRSVRSNSFGYFDFQDLEVGQTYVISVRSKSYSFANATRLITLNEDLTEENFVSQDR